MPVPTDELKDQIERLADSQAAIKDEIHSLRLETTKVVGALGERLELGLTKAVGTLSERLESDKRDLQLEMAKNVGTLSERLESDKRDLQLEMAKNVGTLSERLESDKRDLQLEMAKNVGTLSERLTAFESKVLTTLSILKWVGGIVGGILVINALNGVYWAGSLSADVRNLTKEVQTLNERVGELNKHALPAREK